LRGFIATLPALEALRSAYPKTELCVLGSPWLAELLRERPGPVDRVLVETLEERFDLVIQLDNDVARSNTRALALGAAHTLGLKTPDAPALERWVPYVPHHNEVLRHLEVVALAGAPVTRLDPRLRVIRRDLDESARAVPETDAPLVVLQPSARDPRRRWPPSAFAEVGDALASVGARILMTGTEDDRPLVAEVMRLMRRTPEDLCGRLSLGGLAGLLSRARLLVANDAAPFHLGAAVGAPSAGIFWAGRLVGFGPVHFARARPLVSWRMRCPSCDRPAFEDPPCDHESALVGDVTVREVLDAATSLFEAA
jgi:ADP-heptose:LPS heptosyltransferase